MLIICKEILLLLPKQNNNKKIRLKRFQVNLCYLTGKGTKSYQKHFRVFSSVIFSLQKIQIWGPIKAKVIINRNFRNKNIASCQPTQSWFFSLSITFVNVWKPHYSIKIYRLPIDFISTHFCEKTLYSCFFHP